MMFAYGAQSHNPILVGDYVFVLDEPIPKIGGFRVAFMMLHVYDFLFPLRNMFAFDLQGSSVSLIEIVRPNTLHS
jgi:hypothetical protein